MLKFDRIVLVVLALGVWALVLKPQELGAHHEDADHDCSISGFAFGDVADGIADVYLWEGVTVDCAHK
jgi:hypothetical protein